MTYSSPEKRTRKRRRIVQDTSSTSITTPSEIVDCEVATPSTSSITESSMENASSDIRTSAARISYQEIRENSHLVSHYTGLPTDAVFNSLLQFCSRFEVRFASFTVRSVSQEDQLLLTLMKLRQNYSHIHLAFLFRISTSTVTNITSTWIDILHEMLFVGVMKAVGIPSRHKNASSSPDCFKTFHGTRIIIDCTEIQCAVPRASMAQQSSTFSHYKQRNTFKALVGVTPNGTLTCQRVVSGIIV